MTLQTSIGLLCLFTFQTVNSQCIDKDKIKYGGNYDFVPYLFHCPSYKFEYGGDTSAIWSILDPVDIKKTGKDFFPLKDKIEGRIRAFAGEQFFKKVKFSSVEIVYKDSLQKMLDSGRVDVIDNNCKAKYYFYYNFIPDTITAWCFGIAVNENGKIISPFTFPSKKYYKPIDTTINYCELLAIAKKTQPNIEPIDEMKLEYDPKVKRFYWLITQQIINPKEGRNDFYQVAIDAADKSRVVSFKGGAFIQF
jgi:hypothetical protein